MSDGRLTSGHQPLDEVLDGGLPGHAISIIMGLPAGDAPGEPASIGRISWRW